MQLQVSQGTKGAPGFSNVPMNASVISSFEKPLEP